jgi:hypothetical protein
MAAFSWQEFLQTLGGQAVLLAAVGYLIKTLVSSRLEKDAEAFKADLKRNADIEIERLKNALQMTAIEHQVRFSKLHEQRVEIIGKLSRLIQDAPSFVARLILKDNRNAENIDRAGALTVDLLTCVPANRVIFPEELWDRLDHYSKRLYSMVIVFDIYWRSDEILTPETKAIQEKVLENASSVLKGEINPTRDKLIDDLRKLLTGSSD